MQSRESENLELQSEELYALQSIYGQENCRIDSEEHSCEILIPCNDETRLCLQVYFPASYPSTSAPIAHLSGPHLSPDLISSTVVQLEQQYRPGENVVYTWVEWLKENTDLWPPARPPESAVRSNTTAALNVELTGKQHQDAEESLHQAQLWNQAKLEIAERAEVEAKIFHGEPFTERKSTFQAHLAKVRSRDGVEKVMTILLENPKVLTQFESEQIQKATHNIIAYRIETSNDTFLQDTDDDGESAAGGRLLHLLQIVDARDVVVVVSRWYGGIHLGPARFTHINNAARLLLDSCGYIRKGKKGK